MKKLLLGICMMLVSQMTVFASKDVTITVSSDGVTKEEAIAKLKEMVFADKEYCEVNE